MKKYIFIAAALTTAFLAGSCQKEKVQDSITLSTEKSISAVYEAASYDVVFTTNVAWTATTQATAGDAFFALDKTSGSAGTATLKLSVEKNEAIATRTGIITITAGTATQVINIIQDAVGSTSEDQEKAIDSQAQVFDIAVMAKPSQVIVNDAWVAYEATDNKVTFSIAENTTTKTRVANVKIIVVKHTINLKITQATPFVSMNAPVVSYLGHRALPYDTEGYKYPTFGQYQLGFTFDGGSLNLVINSDPEDEDVDPTTVPEGVFVADDNGTFADQTFSTFGEFKTSVTLDGKEIEVAEGSVIIEETGGVYSIEVVLYDEEENAYLYSYTGELGEVQKDDFGGVLVYTNPVYSNYNTYFAGNAYQWSISLILSAAPSADSGFVSFVTFYVYTEASAAGDVFPTGTFAYEVPQADPEITGKGNIKAKPGTFYFSGNDIPQNYITVNNAGNLVISKDASGNYTFAITSNLTMAEETFDWNPTITFPMPKVSEGLMATPDAEEVTFSNASKPGNYVGYWYSDLYGDGWNAFAFGWNAYLDGVYTVFLTVNSDQSYTYEKNYANRFCKNPIPAGTYEFANEAAANTLLPTSRCYIQNTYTGTKFMVNGGSIVITDSSVAFDGVTGMQTSTGLTCTFNGSFDTTCMYQQDYSDHSKRTLPIKPVVGPQDN